MTCKAPHALSLQWKTIRKKFPYEGHLRRGDRAGETHTALLEVRTALQKQCETILLLQSVFFKMSEGEHLDSEFYYPSDRSDAEKLRINAATCMSSFHKKKENKKKNGHMIKCLLTK